MGLDGGTTATRADASRKLVGAQRRGSVDVHARWTRSRRRVERARARERGRSRRSLARGGRRARSRDEDSRGRGASSRVARADDCTIKRPRWSESSREEARSSTTGSCTRSRTGRTTRERRARRSICARGETSSTFGTRAAAAPGPPPPTIRSSPSVPCSVSSPDERMNGSSPLDRVDAS